MQSAGKVLSSWLSACEVHVLLYAVFIIYATFPFGVEFDCISS